MNAYYRSPYSSNVYRDAYPSFTPVVVIDPKDREQVERLADCLMATDPNRAIEDNLAAALREFANPTPDAPAKPDEPTGLGAVVEDSDGRRWVRARPLSVEHPHVWRWSGIWKTYADIDVDCVLSEGVTEDES